MCTALLPFGEETSAPVTMSSREIAELTGKEHRTVLLDIRVMLCDLYPKSGVNPSFFSYLEKSRVSSLESIADYHAIAKKGVKLHLDNLGDLAEILLPKRETLVLISGYRVDLRARIIDRWQELEAKQIEPKIPDFTKPAIAARAWADEYERAQRLALESAALTQQNAILKPKAFVADMIANTAGLLTMNEVAKPLDLLTIGKNRLFEILRQEKILQRNSKDRMIHNTPYQRYIDEGYFQIRYTQVPNNGSMMMVAQTMVTPKGRNWIIGKIRERQDRLSAWDRRNDAVSSECQRNA
jgi:anti-repressor protein